jgi:hypothetical protein
MIPNTKITIGHQAVKISSNDHRLKLIVMGLFNHLTKNEIWVRRKSLTHSCIYRYLHL